MVALPNTLSTGLVTWNDSGSDTTTLLVSNPSQPWGTLRVMSWLEFAVTGPSATETCAETLLHMMVLNARVEKASLFNSFLHL